MSSQIRRDVTTAIGFNSTKKDERTEQEVIEQAVRSKIDKIIAETFKNELNELNVYFAGQETCSELWEARSNCARATAKAYIQARDNQQAFVVPETGAAL